VPLELLGELGRALIAGLEHDKGERLHEPLLVFAADHRGFQHGLVGDQRRFDFDRETYIPPTFSMSSVRPA